MPLRFIFWWNELSRKLKIKKAIITLCSIEKILSDLIYYLAEHFQKIILNTIVFQEMYCRNLCTQYKVVRPARGSPYLIGLKRCIHCKIYMIFDGTRCPCCSVRLRTRPHNTKAKERILTEIRRIWWIEIGTKAVMSCYCYDLQLEGQR